MSLEDELIALARERERAYESSLSEMLLDHRAKQRLQLRHYLAEQTDRGRLKQTYDAVPRIETTGELQELVCEAVEFRSGSKLAFNIQISPQLAG